MKLLRKIIAITLLAVFGLPFAQALSELTPKSEANLPACCRHSGKHHCAMSMAERGQMLDDKPRFDAPADKCPYMPLAIQGIRHPMSAMPGSTQLIYDGLLSHPNGVVQSECRFRIARDRARDKRGPPFLKA